MMSREDSAALSLHEKNAYLQELARQCAEVNDRDVAELDKVSLSRLRRYYSRRVWADLKLGEMDGDAISQSLRRLGEAIRNNSLRQDVEAVLKQESVHKRILRPAPAEDAQLTFFVPTVYDAPFKDDVDRMDVAPF